MSGCLEATGKTSIVSLAPNLVLLAAFKRYGRGLSAAGGAIFRGFLKSFVQDKTEWQPDESSPVHGWEPDEKHQNKKMRRNLVHVGPHLKFSNVAE